MRWEEFELSRDLVNQLQRQPFRFFVVFLRLVHSFILIVPTYVWIYFCWKITIKRFPIEVKIYFTNRLFSLLQSSDSIKRNIHCPSMCCCSSCSSSTVADLAKTLNPWSRAASSSSSSWWSKESYGKKYGYSGYRSNCTSSFRFLAQDVRPKGLKFIQDSKISCYVIIHEMKKAMQFSNQTLVYPHQI